MWNTAIAAVLSMASLAILASEQTTQPQRKPLPGTLKVGDAAPDFTIHDIDGKVATTLSKLRGKPVVLVFGSCT